MARMHRTQIYLDPQLNLDLEREARRRGISKASLLRLAARRFLEDDRPDPILGLIGIGNSGKGETSVQHDRILAEHARSPRP